MASLLTRLVFLYCISTSKVCILFSPRGRSGSPTGGGNAALVCPIAQQGRVARATTHELLTYGAYCSGAKGGVPSYYTTPRFMPPTIP